MRSPIGSTIMLPSNPRSVSEPAHFHRDARPRLKVTIWLTKTNHSKETVTAGSMLTSMENTRMRKRLMKKLLKSEDVKLSPLRRQLTLVGMGRIIVIVIRIPSGLRFKPFNYT